MATDASAAAAVASADDEAMLCKMTPSHWKDGHLVPTYFVSQKPRRGFFRRIRDALNQAPPYSRVEIVGGGTFHEKLVLEKPVEIGASKSNEPPVVTHKTTPLTLNAAEAFVEGIAVEVEWSIPSCVVSRGSPTIKWCFFQGVEVLGTSTPNLVECKIVDAKIHGLRVAGQAGGLYTKNTIWGHTGYSIMVESTGEPTFSYNIISESQSGQIYVKNGEDDGLVAPTFLLNRISDNITTAQNTQISTGVDDHLVLPSYKLDALPVKETGMRVLLMPVEDRGEAVRFDDDDVVNDPIMKNTNPRCAVLVSGSRTKPTFTRNAISTCQMHGFFVRGNSAGTYESNFVTGNKGWGIIVEGGATAAIFTGNQVGSNGGGVKVTGAPATFTDNNLLYGNRGPQLLLESGHERFLCERTIIKSGSRLGVWCAGEGGGTFRGNDFDKCGVGVRLERFASPTFERNSFDGGGIGLYAHTAALGDFIECQFNDLTVAAIVLATAADPHFVQVQIVACSIGVLVTSGGHGVFDQCIVRDARKFGFDVSDGGQPRVVRSEVRGSRQDGLRVWKRGGGHFRNNIFACNEGAQVRITRTADPLLEENFIGHTAHDGVVIEDGGLGVLCQNLIRSCYGSGINATGSASAPVIRGNYVVGCGNYGIHLTQCGFGTIEKNIILNCRRANIAISGMALTEKSKNGTNNNNNDAGKGEGGGEKAATQAKAKQRLVLRGNVIRGSAWCGILIERQTKVALIQNIISDNVQGIVVRGLSDVVAIRNQLALSTHGILVDEDSSVQLFCNLFHAMSGTALCVLSAVKLVMQWCFISHCATGAIMRRAQRGIFGDNVVRSCHQYGLVLGADCRTHITRNLLTDNLVDIFLSDAHCHADCYDNCLMRSTGQSVRVLGEKMDLASFHGNVILSAAVGVCAMRGNLKLRHCLVLNCGEGVVASRVPPSTLPGDHLHPASDDVTSTSTTRSPATPTPQVPTNATILEHCFIGCCGVGGRTGCPSGVALRRSLLTQNDVGFVFRGSAASFIIDASICINSAAVGILACDGAAGTVSNTIFMKNFINVAMVTGATTAMGKCVMQAAVVFSCFMSGAGVMPHLTNCLITSHASAVRHGVHTKEMSEKRDVVETALRKIMGALNVLHPNLEARKETPVDHGPGAISEVQDSRHSPRPTGGALAKLRGKRSPREESVGGVAASSLTGRSSAMRRMAGASITMAGSSTHSARFGSGSPLRPPRASPPPVAVMDSARMPPLVARGADINEADFYAIQRLPSLWADVYEEGSAWRHRDAGSRDFIQPTAQDVSAMLATGTSVDLHLARRVRTNMELLAAPFPENKRRSAILWPSNTSVETTFGGPGGPFLLHRLANSGAAKTSALMMAGGEMAGAATNTLARERFVYVCSGVWLDDGCNPTFDNCYLGEHCHVGANLSRQVGPDGNQGWATDVRPLAASAAPLAFQPLLRHNSTLAASSTHRRRSIGGGGGGGSRAPLPSSVGRSARGGDASSSRYRGTSFTMTTTIVGGGSTASGGGAGAGPANAAVYRPPTIAALCEGSSLLVQLLKLGSPCFWRQLLVTGALPESFPLFTTPGTTTNASEGKSSAMSSERRTGRAVDFGAIHFAPHLQAIDSVATSRIAGCGVIASGGAKGTFYRCTFGRNNHAAVLGDGATTAFKYTKFEAHTSTTVIMEEECCGLLQNCIFRDGRSIPLEVRGHNTSPTIEGNEFTESPFTAISCSLRATPTIVGNRLTAILARAIVVQELAAPIIERNRFDTCTCGVLFQSQSRGRADKNTFNDCSSYGILVEDSGTSPSLRSNNISNGRNAGIGVNGRGCIPLVADNALNDNVIGIHLQRGAQGIYRANILRRQQTGIQVEDSSGEFRRNMLTESVLAGIVVSGSGASPVLVENRIALGRLVGLRVRHAQGQVCRNYVGQNGGDGIVVEGKHTEVVLCANEVSENAGGGLRLMKGCVPIVWANIITQNQKGGILVENTDTSPLMEGNIIKLNEVVGVQFGPDARGYLNGGIVSNTLRGPAVMIQGKGGASLQEMVIADSDQGGVVVRAEGECEVVRCIFINCQGPPALSLASSATGIRITASIFVENGTSIVVESGGSGDCTACAFLGAHTSQTAVKVMRDGTPSFQHCIFAAGKIGFQDAGKARLSRCLFFNLACGAELSGTSTMMECEFRECQSGARPLRNLTLLSGCLFASCKVGLHLADYGQPTVEECAMLRCQRGILAEGNSGGTVRNCRILWNTDNVVVADGAGPNLSSNLIYDASNIGLHVRGGHPVVLQNDIFDSHYTTVLVDAANGGRLEENRISFAREGGALVMNGESARELASNNNTVRNAFSPPGNALFRAVGERNQFYRRNESETERLSPSYLDMRRFIEDVCASTMLRVTTMASRAAAKVVATKDWVVRDGWLGELSSLTGAAAHSTNTTTTPATTTTTTGEAAFTPLQPPPHNESQSRPRGGRPGKPDGTAPTGTPTTMAAPTTPTSTGGADGTTALAMDEPLRSRFDRLPRDVVNAAGRFPAQDHLRRYAGGDEELLSAEATLANIGDDLSGHSITDFDAVMLPSITPPPALTRATSVAAASTTRTVMNSTPAPRALVSPPMEAARRQQEECLPAPMLSTVLHQTKTKLVHVLDALSPPSSNNMINVPYEGIIYRTPMPSVLSMVNEQAANIFGLRFITSCPKQEKQLVSLAASVVFPSAASFGSSKRRGAEGLPELSQRRGTLGPGSDGVGSVNRRRGGPLENSQTTIMPNVPPSAASGKAAANSLPPLSTSRRPPVLPIIQPEEGGGRRAPKKKLAKKKRKK